jgi:hypothetical protein
MDMPLSRFILSVFSGQLANQGQRFLAAPLEICHAVQPLLMQAWMTAWQPVEVRWLLLLLLSPSCQF